MQKLTRSIYLICLLVLASTPTFAAQTVVEPFKNSVEKGVFETQFDAFGYALASGAEPVLKRVEGSIVSRVLLKPADKSNLEVFRSYEQELQAAGFTMLLATSPAGVNPKNMIRELYTTPFNDLSNRSYRNSDNSVSTNDLARISTFGQYYLSAKRTQGDITLFVALVLSKERNLYLIDELSTAAMETGTVTINLDAILSAIKETGKIAIYDVHFAAGSAQIKSASNDALKTIATYLEQASGRFYIVGHTDDTGALSNNLGLSARRAVAVKTALVADFGISGDRLEARGVGPLAPISKNTNEQGRALNRRVEIVQRLENN